MLPLPEPKPCEAERRGISQHPRKRIEQPNSPRCLLDCVEAFHFNTAYRIGPSLVPRCALRYRHSFLTRPPCGLRIRSLLLMLRLLGLGVSLRTGRVVSLSHGR